MNCKFNILNRAHSADQKFTVYQTSGDPDELPDEIKESITYAQAEDLEGGNWIIYWDGNVEVYETTHPFLIQVEEDEPMFDDGELGAIRTLCHLVFSETPPGSEQAEMARELLDKMDEEGL